MLKDLLCCPQPQPTKSDNRAQGAKCSRWLSHQGWPVKLCPSVNIRAIVKMKQVNSVLRGYALLLMAFTGWTEPVLARSYLDCPTKKVVILDAPRGSTSSSVEEQLGFWIDEAAKTVVLADGTPLTVHRFDDRWISAA